MIKKFICLTALAATLFPFAVNAQNVTEQNIETSYNTGGLEGGNIKAFLVKGTDVTLTNNATGEVTPVKRGDVFTDGTTIKTGENSTVVLILSNGSSVRVGPSSEFEIVEFKQETFDPAMGSYLTLTQDPSQSKTNVKLKSGTMAGETKHLSASSEYVVSTPLGSAGIRGTTFSATVKMEVVDGKAVYTVTFAKGKGTVTYTADQVSGELGDGEEVTITGSVDDNTGEVTIDSVSDPQAISPETQAALEELIEDTGSNDDNTNAADNSADTSETNDNTTEISGSTNEQ